MLRAAVRVLVAVSCLSPVALAEDAEDGIEKAQQELEGATKELGKKAGVRPEVLDGGSYGSAGCGLGSLIFEPNNSFTQVFAATTNGSSGTQTFGISSGTSNCDGQPATAQAVRNFIVANRARLSVDVARGRGETVEALSALAQCRDQAVLAGTLQRNFSSIFPSAQVSDAQVSQRMLRVMSAPGPLGCRVLV